MGCVLDSIDRAKANHLKLVIRFLRDGIRLSRERTVAVQDTHRELKVEPGEFSGKQGDGALLFQESKLLLKS